MSQFFRYFSTLCVNTVCSNKHHIKNQDSHSFLSPNHITEIYHPGGSCRCPRYQFNFQANNNKTTNIQATVSWKPPATISFIYAANRRFQPLCTFTTIPLCKDTYSHSITSLGIRYRIPPPYLLLLPWSTPPCPTSLLLLLLLLFATTF